MDSDTFGKQDPYVKFRLQGKLHTHELRTRTDKDGGTSPKWDQSFALELVDQYVLEMEVYDEDTMDKDDLIGKANIPLLPVFKRGYVEAWVTIKVPEPLHLACPLLPPLTQALASRVPARQQVGLGGENGRD